MTYFPHTPITIRLAGARDADTLKQLAALDSANGAPDGRVLIAELGGVPRAALSLDSGFAVADPFVPTATAVALLKLRAREAGRRPGHSPGQRLAGRVRHALHRDVAAAR